MLLEHLDDHQDDDDDDDHLEHLVHRVRWGQAAVQTHLHTLVSSCFLITLIKCLKGHKRRLIVFLKVLTIVTKATHRERFNHEVAVAEVSH